MEEAVRSAQDTARAELEFAIAKAAAEHAAELQRAASEAQQARGQVSAEVGEVRAAEKARYDRRLAELETSIESRMSQLHAAARAHIEAEVTVRPQNPDS